MAAGNPPRAAAIVVAAITLHGVSKVFPGSVSAVRDLCLKIADGEFVVLVGPSGCGKTTTLRMIAGLESVSGGEIHFDGQRVDPLPPRDRDVAMVFQHHALYPHMTVHENLAFGLKVRNIPREEIRRRVTDVAGRLGLTELLDRRPHALSGGQRQRVALGRAVVRQPRVFLFDEPLSNLDAALRTQMRVEIKQLHRRLGATMVYVTHDQIEAMTLGDRVVVMKDGLVRQIADPATLYDRPADMFVAGFIGTPPMNFLPGELSTAPADASVGELAFRTTGLTLPLPSTWTSAFAGVGTMARRVVLGIKPEHVTVTTTAATTTATSTITPPQGSELRATVEAVEPIGAESHVYLRHADHRIVARVPTNRTPTGRPPSVGDTYVLAVDPRYIHVFDAATEHAIYPDS